MIVQSLCCIMLRPPFSLLRRMKSNRKQRSWLFFWERNTNDFDDLGLGYLGFWGLGISWVCNLGLGPLGPSSEERAGAVPWDPLRLQEQLLEHLAERPEHHALWHEAMGRQAGAGWDGITDGSEVKWIHVDSVPLNRFRFKKGLGDENHDVQKR